MALHVPHSVFGSVHRIASSAARQLGISGEHHAQEHNSWIFALSGERWCLSSLSSGGKRTSDNLAL